MKIIIVGGVAGGATAAARLRRLDENAEIIVIERSGFVSYANCGLPYYIGGVITDKRALTLQTPESFWQRFRIDIRVNQEVTEIDSVKKLVKVRRLNTENAQDLTGTSNLVNSQTDESEEYTETYDKLILSPGALPVRPDVEGIDNERIMSLRTVEDTFKIKDFIEKNNVKRAAIIGGGFIGLEMAENFIGEGISTVLIQRSAQVLPPLDYDMACEVHSYMRAKGLDLMLNSPFEKFEDNSGMGVKVILKNGKSVEADLVLLTVGVNPDTSLAKAAGLKLGMKNGILVDEQMRTSVPDIYAVGDAVVVKNSVSNSDAIISLAGPANKQGRIAADNICGISSKYIGSQGSSVIKLFEMTVASTGLNEKTASAAGMPFDKVITTSSSHAVYFPGSTEMTVKTVFSPETGMILGAQIVGFDGVDKRLDVLATAIRAGMSAYDVSQLDLSYAPPYSSAKDPVNMAGFVIDNVMAGRIKQFYWNDVETLQQNADIILLDVRTRGEFANGHFEGAVNIPLDELRENISQLDKGKHIYVNCHSGLRSYIACCILNQMGFQSFNLAGGYRFYQYVMQDKEYERDSVYSCGEKR